MIESTQKDPQKLAQLEFIMNETLGEMIRENKENGKLKNIENGEAKGNSEFFDPRYLSFIIQSVEHLNQPEVSHNLNN